MIPVDAERQYVVTGRTMDFGQAMDTVLCMIPRGKSFPLIPPANGYHWQNTYGFVAMTAMLDVEHLELAAPYYSDGLNEKGLSAASLWLPGTAYPEPSASVPNVYVADMCALILGMAATVDDAAALLESINVIVFPTMDRIGSMQLYLSFLSEFRRISVIENTGQCEPDGSLLYHCCTDGA